MAAKVLDNDMTGFLFNGFFAVKGLEPKLPEIEEELNTQELLWTLIDKIDALDRKINFIFSDNVIIGGRFVSLRSLTDEN